MKGDGSKLLHLLIDQLRHPHPADDDDDTEALEAAVQLLVDAAVAAARAETHE